MVGGVMSAIFGQQYYGSSVVVDSAEVERAYELVFDDPAGVNSHREYVEGAALPFMEPPGLQPFAVGEMPEGTVGRRFYVFDRRTGRQVGRIWGARHHAERQAAERNAKHRQVHG